MTCFIKSTCKTRHQRKLAACDRHAASILRKAFDIAERLLESGDYDPEVTRLRDDIIWHSRCYAVLNGETRGPDRENLTRIDIDAPEWRDNVICAYARTTAHAECWRRVMVLRDGPIAQRIRAEYRRALDAYGEDDRARAEAVDHALTFLGVCWTFIIPNNLSICGGQPFSNAPTAPRSQLLASSGKLVIEQTGGLDI
jgi:hypothetical protein